MIVIVIKERNPKTGKIEEVVSHGIDENTGSQVVLPSETPQAIGAVFDANLQEYVIRDE